MIIDNCFTVDHDIFPLFGAEEQWLPRRQRNVGTPGECQDVRSAGAVEGACSVNGFPVPQAETRVGNDVLCRDLGSCGVFDGF